MKPWVIGNWKLNPATKNETVELISSIASNSANIDNCNIMLAPSFIHLDAIVKLIEANNRAQSFNNLKVVAQDVTALSKDTGAYTGNVSAAQLKDIGVEWVLLGHSERRQYHNEDNSSLLKKLMYCAAYNLNVIFCIGESETAFASGKTQEVLASQLQVIKTFYDAQQQLMNSDDADTTKNEMESLSNQIAGSINLIVAYEPVWAIGTGKVAEISQVESIHAFIRQNLISFNEHFKNIPIVYGGSVKPDNAVAFAKGLNVDGVLVGGASLASDSFLKIAQSFSDAS